MDKNEIESIETIELMARTLMNTVNNAPEVNDKLHGVLKNVTRILHETTVSLKKYAECKSALQG